MHISGSLQFKPYLLKDQLYMNKNRFRGKSRSLIKK